MGRLRERANRPTLKQWSALVIVRCFRQVYAPGLLGAGAGNGELVLEGDDARAVIIFIPRRH